MKNLLKGNKVSLVACGLLLSSSFAFGADSIDAAFKEGKVSGDITVYGIDTDRKGGKKLLKIKPRDLPKMKQEDTYLPDLYIENFENTEMPNFKKGGLVKSGKPKLAKKGWR